MKVKIWLCTTLLLGWTLPMLAQQRPATEANTVPPLVNFSGTLTDVNGKPLTGVVGVTFLLYKDQDGGAPLWMETQNVEPDKKGHYSVMLGSTSGAGLPSDIFVAGQARWLGVQVQGQAEQPRVLLLSVPYALKAGDAATVGGLPPSAFMLAVPPASSPNNSVASTTPSSSLTGAVNGTGTTDFIPLWTNSTTVGNSVLFQSGTGGAAKVGINTTTPAATLDVRGSETVRGSLTLPAIGTASASKGFISEPVAQSASVFNSTTGKAVSESFQWQAEPTGNNTAAPSATLNLLFGTAGAPPAETGLHIGSSGLITFVKGQTFPGTGNGTITGVTAGTALTGGGNIGNVTLNIDTTKVPQLNTANTFTASQTINGSLSATNLTATSVVFGQLGSFTGSNAGNILIAQNQNTSGGIGIVGNASGSSGIGMEGNAFGSGGTGVQGSGFTGVMGSSSAGNGAGVIGQATGSPSIGVNGVGAATGTGVFGSSGGAFPFIPKGVGVVGESVPANGIGVSGLAFGTNGIGVNAGALGAGGIAVVATGFSAGSGSGLNGGAGMKATGGNSDPTTASLGGDGLDAQGGNGGNSQGNFGIGGFGVQGLGGGGPAFAGPGGNFGGGDSTVCTGEECGGDGIDADAGFDNLGQADGFAGNFGGDLNVSGAITAGTKDFKIDHPLDPANKYLLHASVESSEMMNIYTGNVTTDARGEATVQLPEWFEVLNTDFRYQLTVIGQFAQAIVAREIENHQFTIRTSAPSVKVSWQVTSVRQDAYAKAHPLVVEQQKDARLKGFYIHPEFYGAPAEKQIEWARHPQLMKRRKEMQAGQLSRLIPDRTMSPTK